MPEAQLSLLGQCAAAYAAMGWRVFPIAPRSKIPLTEHGFKDATTDPGQVRAWWARWPDANIGVATGAGSNLFVYDADGAEGAQSHDALEALHGEMPAGPVSLTGKGWHLLFNHFEGGRNSSSTLGQCIDTRGEGGYILVPPSVHPSGAVYSWADGCAPADIERPDVPEWVRKALEKKPAQQQASTWTPPTQDAEHERAYALGALRSAHDELASVREGSRNERLRDAAYALGGYVACGALFEQEIRDALLSACAANGALQSEESKCRDTLERALRKGVEAPRQIPPPRHLRLVKSDSGDSGNAGQNDSGGFGNAQQAPKAPERKWKRAAELATELRPLGPGMPTGFATLDEWTRGGLRAGKLVPIAGAPGAGKTLFATELAHRYFDLGHPVLFYAVDESREGVMTRWGQQCGLVREDLEEAHEHTRNTLAGCFANELVDFVDPDEATLDFVGNWLIARAAELGRAGVLVVDSIQTCRIDGGELLDPRQRIDVVVAILKSFRKAGLLVLATSEVSRGWYRGGDKVDPLAAFKESGAIEYALDVGIVLESVKGETGQVDVWVPKSRLGRADRAEPACRARIDFARASMAEIAKPEEGDGEPTEVGEDPREVEMVAREIERAIVTAQGSITRRGDLERLVRRRRSLASHAVALLLREGRITGGRGQAYRVVSGSTSEGDE